MLGGIEGGSWTDGAILDSQSSSLISSGLESSSDRSLVLCQHNPEFEDTNQLTFPRDR